MASSVPNMKSASALASSVLPTPVGPRNRNEPMGRLGSFRPTRAVLTARLTADTASSWPTMRSCRCSTIDGIPAALVGSQLAGGDAGHQAGGQGDVFVVQPAPQGGPAVAVHCQMGLPVHAHQRAGPMQQLHGRSRQRRAGQRSGAPGVRRRAGCRRRCGGRSRPPAGVYARPGSRRFPSRPPRARARRAHVLPRPDRQPSAR